MTVPVDDGRPPITAPGIHDKPPERPKAPFTQKQLRAIGDALVNQILARVLLAVAGIEVPLLGKPFAFLAAWAKELQDRANDAYNGAVNAQASANYANAQLGAALATNVTGGVAVSEDFNGTVANDLGGGFVRTSNGPGGGFYGPDGDGSAVWKPSGGNVRNHLDRCTLALAGDEQAVLILLTTKVESVSAGGYAYNYLRARINSTNDTYVYARIGRDDLQIGCVVSGSFTSFGTRSISTAAGDVWMFQCGTTTGGIHEFVVYRNGVEVYRRTDSGAVSQYGASYRYVGLGATAANKNFFSGQTKPGSADVWAAADRTAA